MIPVRGITHRKDNKEVAPMYGKDNKKLPLKTLTKSMDHKLSDVNDGIIDRSNNSLAKAVMTSLSGPPASSSLPIALAQPPFVTF